MTTSAKRIGALPAATLVLVGFGWATLAGCAESTTTPPPAPPANSSSAPTPTPEPAAPATTQSPSGP
ncbi:MAG: hypothetical protein KJO43_01540, partial [Phycisphaerae bacterium]|nr:hypothetical protein [Phycisphaerae bacterium]